MAQYKHKHVEDYIEIIAGYREPNGKSNYSIFTVGESPISLARYDMKVIPSLAEQTLGGRGYTDRQAALATQLVIKYERQLFKLGVDITPVSDNPEFRLPLRELDRTTRAWVEDDIIKLRFPYDLTLIEKVREASKSSKGEFKFNRTTKLHEAALTEWNLNWIYSFAKAHNFAVDPSLENLMQLLLDAERDVYRIELVYDNDQFTITNASNSLIEYVNEHLGGFASENILRLSDYAPILGYTVSETIGDNVIKNFSPRFWSLCSNRQLQVSNKHGLVKDIAEYAEATDRFPIFIYEPDLSGRLLKEFVKYFPDAVISLDNKSTENTINEKTKIVYTNKIPKTHFDRIPLMVSSAGMLFGGDRQMWLQSAEKVVYFTEEVYNKTKDKFIKKL